MQKQSGRLLQKGSQKTTFSLVLQNRLHILQLPQNLLLDQIHHLAKLNPLLEIVLNENFSDPFSSLNLEDFFENDEEESSEKISFEKKDLISSIAYIPKIFDELLLDVRDILSEKKYFPLAEYLLGNLEKNGFLLLSEETIAKDCNIPIHELQILLSNLKEKIDPPGLFASCPQESLLIQLKRKNKQNSLAYKILSDYFPEFLKRKFLQIAKNLSCSIKEIQKAIQSDLAFLPFCPLTEQREKIHTPICSIKPDIFIEKDTKNQWCCKLAEEEFFTLRLQKDALTALTLSKTKEEKSFYRHYIKEGIELIYSWETRKDLFRQIAKVLIDSFTPFFEGKEALCPIAVRELALQLNVHTSTISRAIKDKYVEFPLGTMSLSSFFSHKKVRKNQQDVSAKELLLTIMQLIKKENSSSPLSDMELVIKLQEKGFSCSRRSVTKYRKALFIPSSFHRKKK